MQILPTLYKFNSSNLREHVQTGCHVVHVMDLIVPLSHQGNIAIRF